MTEMMTGLVHYALAPLSVELREMPVSEIDEEEVLLRVGAVGVCGSDIHQYHNSQSWPVRVPVVLGHEFCGTVARVGRRVKGFREGDRVVSETAAAVKSQIRPGDTVVVIGPGPIGLLCAEMARQAGAGTLLVAGTSRDASRLGVARVLGATQTVDVQNVNMRESVSGIGDGLGADLVIDAAGASAALQVALEIVRPGGQITKVGWGPQPLNFSLDPLVQKAVRLQGSFSHTFKNWEKVVAMLGAGQINLGPIISQVAALDRWKDCFEGMYVGKYVKAVLQPN